MTKRQNLIKARKLAGLTQTKLSQLVGVTVGAISHLESGRNGARPETWDKLEDILGVPQRQLREIANYSIAQE